MGLRKRGVTFLICSRKREGTQKGEGFPQKSRGSNPGGNYVLTHMACKADVWNMEYLHSALPDPFRKRSAEGVCEFE